MRVKTKYPYPTKVMTVTYMDKNESYHEEEIDIIDWDAISFKFRWI